MNLGKLIESVPTVSVSGNPDRDVTGVVCDSRQVTAGSVFVAIEGYAMDGRVYIDDAVQHGAAAVVSEKNGGNYRNACAIRVSDARVALGLMARCFHGNPSSRLKVVGVTGTNGKTTTAYTIRNMLETAGTKSGLISTVEYLIGARAIPATRTTPDAATLHSMLAQMVNAGCAGAVMEVSSHALDQRRNEGIDYDVAVFTNLTRDHLDYHVTMDKYFDAKSRLFSGLGRGEKNACGVINIDDEWGRKLVALVGGKASVLTYGISSPADIRAADVELGGMGTRFKAETPWGTFSVKMCLFGRYNVFNALAAIGAGGALGMQPETICRALSEMLPVRGRLEEVQNDRGFQVFVDYAHTDDAIENVLKTLREITKGRLIVVFGCGGNRDRTKRPLMGKAAATLADYSIITSDNPRKENPGDIIAEIRKGYGDATNFEVCEEREEAIRRAVEIAGKGDVIVIAGKGHESFQDLANTSVPFDDRQVVKRYL